MTSQRRILLSLLSLAACTAVGLPQGPYLCDAGSDCLTGYTCFNGLCTLAGESNTSATSTSSTGTGTSTGTSGGTSSSGTSSTTTGGSSGCANAYAAEVLADLPTLYYRFEEPPGATTVIDSSGNGLDGTYVYDAGTTILGTAGLVGMCASFAAGGLAQYVPISTLDGTFTVELWTNEASSQDGEIVSTRQGPTPQGGFDIQSDNGGQGGLHGNIFGDNTTLSASADSSVALPLGQWSHIVYVVTPTGYTIYQDGAVTGSGTYDGTPELWDNGDTFDIAGSPIFDYSPTSNYFYSGAIDELAVYPTALSADRVLTHYQTATSCTALELDAGIVAAIPNLTFWVAADVGVVVDAGQVFQWNDQSGNGLNAFQANPALQPSLVPNELNGLPVISCAGQEYLQLPGSPVFLAVSGFAVFRNTGTLDYADDYYEALMFGGPDNVAGAYLGIEFGKYESLNAAGLAIAAGYGNIAEGSQANIAASGPDVPFQLIDWISPSVHTTKIYDDGAAVLMSYPGEEVAWSFTLGSGNPTDLGGICLSPSGVASFNASAPEPQFGEIVLFNRALSDGERQNVEGYLAWKWGLQGSLPDDHPFKDGPP